MEYDAIIIGAGMSGLGAGIRLAHYQKKVCILEQHLVTGGLNSHYTQGGRQFDVGLHAMTNFVPKTTKQAPLTKLIRQLRLSYDDLDLVEQNYSTIDFPSVSLKFGNQHCFLEEQIAQFFPREIDNYSRLVSFIRSYDDVSLDSRFVSAKKVVGTYIKSPLLKNMIFCPIMYYGSAVEQDMDFSQFCIMFKSIFLEGFCRPQIGVRHLLRLLRKRYKENGGELRMSCPVAKILQKNNHAYAVELENGEIIRSKQIFSSAGAYETSRLIKNFPLQEKIAPGKLSFVESILVLNTQPKKLGLKQTISFFSNQDNFDYVCPKGQLADTSSGVICMPNNFLFEDKPLAEGIIRFTSLADYQTWKTLPKKEYKKEKENFITRQISSAGLTHKLKDKIIYTDAFTPLTVEKYTRHTNGAIYGSAQKIKNGSFPIKGLYIIGTDQGFLGIVGALLSGISIANLYGLAK